MLHVITDDTRRGAQVFAIQLAGALDMSCVNRVVALAPSATGGTRLDVDRLGPAPLHPVTLARLRKLMSMSDVAVAHGSKTLLACAIAGAASTPFVYRNIGDPLFWADTPARRLRVRTLLRRAAAVAALWPGSSEVLHQSFGIPRNRLRVIPNAVDTAVLGTPGPDRSTARTRIGLRPDRPTVGFVGALSVEKDVETALRGVPDGWQIALAGDGPLRKELEGLAADILPNRAVFLGATDSPRAAFDAADIALLTSLSEGMPAAMIEAGVLGLPVVATNVGGLSAIVVHGATGLLVEPGDINAVRSALLTGLENAQEWGAAAAAHCTREFAVETVADRWLRLLTDVHGQKPSSHVPSPVRRSAD